LAVIPALYRPPRTGALSRMITVHTIGIGVGNATLLLAIGL